MPLVVRNLTKAFAGRPVFQDISLALSPGEVVSLMGPSGSGKTTFLRCLTGFERAGSGTISVGDVELHAQDSPERFLPAALAVRRRVGLVFQGWHLFAHRTVVENVMEGPVVVQGTAAVEARDQAMRLLERMGVGHRANAMPHQLSGGEQQRVALARALAQGPGVLLLDEPTSALDEARANSLADLLRGLAAEDGLAVLAVTHDARFASSLSSRILLLDGGRVVQRPA